MELIILFQTGGDRMKTLRVEKLCKKMREHGIDQVIVTSKANVYYFTGAYLDPMRRLLALIINSDGSSVYYVNRLFHIDSCVQTELVFWDDTQDPTELMGKAIKKGGTVAVDQDWQARFLLGLMKVQPDASYINMPELIDSLRAVKDQEEIEILKESSRINDKVMTEIFENIRPDISELALSRMRYELFAKYGANAYGTNVIFSYGAHCAEAHHVSDDTLPKAGDCIMFDMGAPCQYYGSDQTRTVFYKEVSPEMEKIYHIVLRAHLEASAAIRPGVPCSEIDRIARDIISGEGYGAYFTHRTGHGIGLDSHEFPDISLSCHAPLEEGMVFSVEPGIYLPGKGGVRIENLFVVTKDGSETLNHLPRELKVIG